jgi:hypothetical protein
VLSCLWGWETFLSMRCWRVVHFPFEKAFSVLVSSKGEVCLEYYWSIWYVLWKTCSNAINWICYRRTSPPSLLSLPFYLFS